MAIFKYSWVLYDNEYKYRIEDRCMVTQSQSLDIYLKIMVDTGGREKRNLQCFWGNSTHNVSNMWKEAGVYDALYNSEGMLAADLIPALEKGLKIMRKNPNKFNAMSHPTWGSYELALPFLNDFKNACIDHPKSKVFVTPNEVPLMDAGSTPAVGYGGRKVV